MNEHRGFGERMGRLGVGFVAIWFLLAALIVVSLFVDMRVRPSWLLTIYAISTVACSLVVFILYGVDKRRARRNQWRISERTLHGLSLAGGWPGAFFAQRLFRHKTAKLPFRAVFWSTVGLHVAVVGYAIWSTLFATGGS